MNLQQLSQELNAIAKRAGAFIKQEAQNFDRSTIEMKGFANMVSYVDKQAEEMLVEDLRKLLPEAGFITEEGTDTTRQERYNWVIDPLDGTTNFTHGLPLFSVSVGLMEYNEIVAGVVYGVMQDECFWAYKGGGAYCNDKKIHVSDISTLEQSLIITGFPYYEETKAKQYLEILHAFMARSHGFRRLGSAALDLAYVAAGRAETFFEYNLQPYDVAAGIILVQEAGGHVSMFGDGDDFIFGKQIIGSNGHIHQQVKDTINEFWK
ncbi:inositol monophosphatase family protein [Pontibacter sp. 13R65]|uniref:inositol monophosphatase family protein n=1 Tax=Pontibacter sp. 13R65 TaxID=3127458 RepID=UPI00301B96C0